MRDYFDLPHYSVGRSALCRLVYYNNNNNNNKNINNNKNNNNNNNNNNSNTTTATTITAKKKTNQQPHSAHDLDGYLEPLMPKTAYSTSTFFHTRSVPASRGQAGVSQTIG